MEKEIAWLLKEKYNGNISKSFYDDVKRLKKGEPLAYVIGFTEFLGCTIDLSKRPLIPRSETEHWTQKAIDEIRKTKSAPRILDIFAGSGCIGISIMRHVNNAKIVFAEKNKNFCRQIAINCKINNLALRRYKIIQSDVFKKVKGRFDYILANPPYIAKTKKSKLQKSVLNHEPAMALFGGKNGFFHIAKFLKQAPDFLNPTGKIYMEFDSIQKEGIEMLLYRLGYTDVTFFKDQYQRFRYVVIGKPDFTHKNKM